MEARDPSNSTLRRASGLQEIMRLVLLSGEDTLETLAAVRSGASEKVFWRRRQWCDFPWLVLKGIYHYKKMVMFPLLVLKGIVAVRFDRFGPWLPFFVRLF